VWVLKLIEDLDVVPAQYFQKLVILTNRFAKKTQKTPPQEIRLAEQRMRDYFARKQELSSEGERDEIGQDNDREGSGDE
jgi:hypothetical protein